MKKPLRVLVEGLACYRICPFCLTTSSKGCRACKAHKYKEVKTIDIEDLYTLIDPDMEVEVPEFLLGPPR